jgi:hypothetical protein
MSGFQLTPLTQPNFGHLPHQLAAWHDWVGLTRRGVVPLSFSMRQEPLDRHLNRVLRDFSSLQASWPAARPPILQPALDWLNKNLPHDILQKTVEDLNPITIPAINIASGKQATIGDVLSDGKLKLVAPGELVPGFHLGIGKNFKFIRTADIRFGLIIDKDAIVSWWPDPKYPLIVSGVNFVVKDSRYPWLTIAVTTGRDQTGRGAESISVVYHFPSPRRTTPRPPPLPARWR